jgi:hypothetical protein
MYKTTNDTCYSGDLGDPEGDYADRWVRTYSDRHLHVTATCVEPGCSRKQTVKGPRCMPCFIEHLTATKGN